MLSQSQIAAYLSDSKSAHLPMTSNLAKNLKYEHIDQNVDLIIYYHLQILKAKFL